MKLRSSNKRGTGVHNAEGVSNGRGFNGDPGRLQVKSINNSNSDSNINALGDGSISKIFKCGSKRCKFQHQFTPQDYIVSTSTNRKYKCIVPDNSIYINCHSSNLIFIITCSNCKLQYVGETSQKLNERFGWHKSCLKDPKKYSFCKKLSAHFNEGLCKNANYTVSIIEKLEGTGRTERNAMDVQSREPRKSRDTQWMLEVRTVYPYGLNDRIGDEYKDENTHSAVFNKFPSLPRNFPRITRGKSHIGIAKMTKDTFLHDLDELLSNRIQETPNYIRIVLSSSKKSTLRDIYTFINNKLSDNDVNNFTLYYLQILESLNLNYIDHYHQKRLEIYQKIFALSISIIRLWK